MEPEDRKMLAEVLAISQQNNRMLRQMRREVLWARFLHVVYWIVIIVIACISYYYIKPYIGLLNQAIETSASLSKYLPR